MLAVGEGNTVPNFVGRLLNYDLSVSGGVPLYLKIAAHSPPCTLPELLSYTALAA